MVIPDYALTMIHLVIPFLETGHREPLKAQQVIMLGRVIFPPAQLDSLA